MVFFQAHSKILWLSSILTIIVVNGITASSAYKIGKCNETRRGKHLVYQSSSGDDKNLVCLKKNGVYQWTFSGGSPTLGEEFDPANDCSDIVDNVPEAKDGFFWILTGKGTAQKVWCDVQTDGGGFMLIGMKESPVTWNVSSNSKPVDPKGPQHWSSVFGDRKVQDFRIQVSVNKGFTGTRAHWLYRFSPERKLGRLFIRNNGGCTRSYPGIGNISYVKDLLTATIVTRSFGCSKFGPHTASGLGWARMNACLQHKCTAGFAYFPGLLFHKFSDFGSFSYSVMSPSSGIIHDSTAFVGCEHNKCCACFGPKGGRRNYCSPVCTAINGGTVTKTAFVWFWIRTKLPNRLWRSCMEYEKQLANGKIVNYHVDPVTGLSKRGSCSKQLKTLLNEGTLVVADKNTLTKLPHVPGVLSYLKDNKKLYVNEGSRWEPFSKESEVKDVKAMNKLQNNKIQTLGNKIQRLEQLQNNKIQTLGNKIQTLEQLQNNKIQTLGNKIQRLEQLVESQSCSTIRTLHPSSTSGSYRIKPGGYSSFKVYCDMTSKNGIGVTVIGHDRSGAKTKVQGYEAAGSYRRKIKYDVNLRQIDRLIQVSRYCEQYVRYECYEAAFSFGPTDRYTWWVSREGAQMNYWGGAAVNSGKCACGMTGSCAGGKNCNCDNNDSVWRVDRGFLKDKNTLPVTEIRVGDTGDKNELSLYSVGKLRCWGP